ncbi:hypothetical protein Scep_029178 [Stephania cephalantha]|uniref:Cystatin domain-containing protein n=1 Tax=Stephania cephalantha TaxID=152367 RepID=A0AAP0HFC8_9MAGN
MAFPQPHASPPHRFSPPIKPHPNPPINQSIPKSNRPPPEMKNSILTLPLMATLITISISLSIVIGNCSGEEEEKSLGLGFRGWRKVGGRTRVSDVDRNEEVQRLGRFSVEEHNKNVIGVAKNDAAAATPSLSEEEEEVLEFRRVVAAERQVVSGIKYYLRIEAERSGGDLRVFDAVVVVKPWVRPPKQLLHFSPSSSSSSDD